MGTQKSGTRSKIAKRCKDGDRVCEYTRTGRRPQRRGHLTEAPATSPTNQDPGPVGTVSMGGNGGGGKSAAYMLGRQAALPHYGVFKVK